MIGELLETLLEADAYGIEETAGWIYPDGKFEALDRRTTHAVWVAWNEGHGDPLRYEEAELEEMLEDYLRENQVVRVASSNAFDFQVEPTKAQLREIIRIFRKSGEDWIYIQWSQGSDKLSRTEATLENFVELYTGT